MAPPAVAAARTAYEAHRRILEEALTEYRKTPDYTGEESLYRVVRTSLARVDAAVRDGAPPAQIDAAIDEADGTLHALSELNRSHLVSAANALAHKARRRNLYAFLLDGLGIVGAFIATVLAARYVEGTLRTLGRRERELEHLALEVGHEIASPLTPIELALGTDEGSAGEPKHGAMSRARRGVMRIRGSLERLTTFAAAGQPPGSPAPRTPLVPALDAAAREAGLDPVAAVDPRLEVSCAEPSLRALLRDLVCSCATPGAYPPATVDVSVTRDRVRVWVSRPPDGDGAGDPFDPQLRVPGTEHPGLDLRLATVRRRVEACGGQVGVAHRDRQRQQLWIELPRALSGTLTPAPARSGARSSRTARPCRTACAGCRRPRWARAWPRAPRR